MNSSAKSGRAVLLKCSVSRGTPVLSRMRLEAFFPPLYYFTTLTTLSHLSSSPQWSKWMRQWVFFFQLVWWI